MNTIHSTGILNNLAQLTVGISTPHFLYLNEATHGLLKPKAAKKAAGALKAIDGNSRAIERCSLPAYKNPRELLLHLSQSNAYHRQLADDVELANKVFRAYHDLSEKPFHERLTADPRPTLQSQLYNPAEYDPLRGISALWRTVECRDCWAKIPATENAFENVIDLFQPPLHLLVGGFMTYFAMMEQTDKGQIHLDAALAWFQLMEEYVFRTIRISAEFVAPKIHDFQTGAVIAATSSEEEPQSVIDVEELEQLITVLEGIDLGLDILGSELTDRTGKMAIQVGQGAHELKKQHTTPLIERITAASTRGGEIAEG